MFAYRAADIKEDKLPDTWENVLSIAKAVENKRKIGYVARIGPGNSIVTDFMPILWAYDSDSFPEYPGEGPPLKHPQAAFATLKALVAGHKNLGRASIDDFDVSAYLQSGQASMGIVWTAWAMMLALADERTPPAPRDLALAKGTGQVSPSNGTLRYTGIPKGPSSMAKPELGVWLLAIPSKSNHKNLALDFIKFATDMSPGPERYQQEIIAAHYGTPPARRGALDRLGADPLFKGLVPAIQDSLENARLRPRTPCWREIESRLGGFLERFTEERLNGVQITEQANQELEPLFEDEGCRTFLISSQQR
jgi:multiple sugar transport system substrate-binding protein